MRFMKAAKEKSEKAVRPCGEAAFCINRRYKAQLSDSERPAAFHSLFPLRLL
jgi:hypothetical protein